MPSISTQYTPFESLLFLQLIVRSGLDPTSLSSISLSLKNNRFVNSDEKYDVHRLAPDALRTLYDELVDDEERVRQHSINGQDTICAINSPHRKSPVPSDPSTRSGDAVSKASQMVDGFYARSGDAASKASHMVDDLYARYRDRIVQTIKQEEQEYQNLVDGIKTLQDEAQAVQKASEEAIQEGLATPQLPSSADPSPLPAQDGPTSLIPPPRDGMPSQDTSHAQYADRKLPEPSYGQMLPPPTSGSEAVFPHSPSAPLAENQGQSTSAAPLSPAPSNNVTGQVQQPPVILLGYGQLPPPLPLPSTTSPRQSNTLPPISSIVSQPTAPKAPPSRKKSLGSAASRASPLLPSPSPHYQQAPYGYPYPAWPQYHQQNPPYAHSQFYQHQHQQQQQHQEQQQQQQQYPRNLPPAQSPAYNQYHPYPPPPNHFSPRPYPPPIAHQTPQYAQFQWPGQPASASPSVKHFDDRPRIRSSGTSTPWTPGGIRGRSPERPVRERDVSPLSDRAPSPEARAESKRVKQRSTSQEPSPSGPSRPAGGRCSRVARGSGSNHSATLTSQSRSQSLASATSDTRPERGDGPHSSIQHIKHEPPSTPGPFASDSEHRSSGPRRRRRDRSDAGPVAASPSGRGTHTHKRKRGHERESGTEPSSSPSPTPSLPTPRAPPGNRLRPRPDPIDPSLVATSKNFARMAAPVLNDVNGHKLAGIFAKPLTEREAPGYRDLVYRAQDLKTIRAAVVRGSRAANLVIEGVEGEVRGEEEGGGGEGGKLITTSIAGGGAAATPSGSFLVRKTEELMPPRGIVNSAQLEMEFMRMFANAVMFNPLPPSERGVPPQLVGQGDKGGVASLWRGKEGKEKGKERKEGKKRKEKGKEKGKDKGDGAAGAGAGAAGADTTDRKGYAQEEEGSIIHDTREMFESVEKVVAQWRSVEQGGPYMVDDVPRSSAGMMATAVGASNTGLRGPSASMAASDALTVGGEESAGEDGVEGVGVGMAKGLGVAKANPARKRRRVGD